jgi:transketolase
MKQLKKQFITDILLLSHQSKEGHIPSSLSVLDIIYNIYKNQIIETNNSFVLSKGHASLALYVVLKHFNVFVEDLNTFCKFDSKIGGHPSSILNGVECSTGSLGHGMPYALGIALSKKILKKKDKVFTIIGDGEANEGTIWETALLASQHKLNNFYCILDHNHSTDRALNIGNIINKFESFGWHCIEIDGHDEEQIKKSLEITTNEKPIFILANTIKGKGCKLLENNPEWHHKSPDENQIVSLLKELEYEYAKAIY